MAALLKDRDLAGREQAIEAVATETADLAGPEMIDGGRFAFPQEGYVAVAKA